MINDFFRVFKFNRKTGRAAMFSPDISRIKLINVHIINIVLQIALFLRYNVGLL